MGKSSSPCSGRDTWAHIGTFMATTRDPGGEAGNEKMRGKTYLAEGRGSNKRHSLQGRCASSLEAAKERRREASHSPRGRRSYSERAAAARQPRIRVWLPKAAGCARCRREGVQRIPTSSLCARGSDSPQAIRPNMGFGRRGENQSKPNRFRKK